MNRRSFGVFVLIFLMMVSASEASAFRCGTRLVAVGDSKYEVLKKCGEPSSVESWLEKRVEPYSVEPFSDGRRFYLQNPTIATIVYVEVEQWLYDFGRNRFIRTLTFENNRLTRIETGGYGY